MERRGQEVKCGEEGTGSKMWRGQEVQIVTEGEGREGTRVNNWDIGEH